MGIRFCQGVVADMLSGLKLRLGICRGAWFVIMRSQQSESCTPFQRSAASRKLPNGYRKHDPLWKGTCLTRPGTSLTTIGTALPQA